MKILNGPSGVWCLGRSGQALLPHRFADPDGRLTDDGRAELARTGIDAPTRTDRCYSLTVVTSTACNLGCPYCFQNTANAAPGRFDPPRIPRRVLDSATIDKLVVFAGAGMRRLGVTDLFVLLFGGEPLLNPAGCLDVLRRCGQLGTVEASMVTNGVLFTPSIAGQLERHGLSSVQVTLDGPARLHDRLRATRDGHGTFARILANLAAVQRATGIATDLRLNATRSALPYLPELVDELADRLDPARCTLHIAPVLNYAGQFDDVPGRASADVAAVLAGYARALTRGFEVSRPRLATCRFCAERDGRTGAVVNADGTLYSCWETIGKPGWEVGSFDTGYSDYPADRWVSCGAFAARETNPAPAGNFDDELTIALLELLRAHRLRPPVAVPAPNRTGEPS